MFPSLYRNMFIGGVRIKLSFAPLVATSFLILVFIAGLSAASSSDADASEASVSPLYDYRYNQAAKDLGILDSGASVSELSYGSIDTASLNPEDECQGDECKLTIKEAEADGGATSAVTCGGATSCGGVQTCASTCASSCSPSCGLNSCAEANTCGNTCLGTCSSSCGSTCGTTCGQTYGGTCARSCSSTCTDTCGSNTCGRDTCAETCSASCGLASCGPVTACGGDYTCGQTCSSSCGGTCGYTCYSSCYSTCALTCGGTCGSTCGVTCVNTCISTCAVTCGSTCSNTCGNTCANTCARTCAITCAQTCSSTCSSMCVTVPATPSANVPLAKSTARTPATAEQNALMPYDFKASPPVSVYYNGANMPWATFSQSFSGNNLLAWVEMNNNIWGVDGRAPRGTWIREFVYVPASGNLVLYRTAPTGTTSKDFGPTTPGYKYVWFYSDLPGTYAGTFNIGGLQSNNITISVY